MSEITAAAAPDALLQMLGQEMPRTAHELRGLVDRFAALVNQGLPEIGALHEAVPVAPGVSADVLVPRGEGPHPVLVYLHGGGWVCGSPRSHRKLAARFAEAGTLVVNVDYRLAPEHPFPTPFEDCVTALRWAAREVERFGGDPQRLAVGGDSAGANLAAAASIALAADPARPRAALLIYGAFDLATLAAEAPGAGPQTGALVEIGKDLLDLMVGSYLGDSPGAALLADPRVSPLRAAERLPPSHIVVGGADPLVAQAETLAAALRRAGVEHEHVVDPGMPHGYAQMEFLPPARVAIDRMIAFLRALLLAPMPGSLRGVARDFIGSSDSCSS
jgi:acetyl esterase